MAYYRTVTAYAKGRWIGKSLKYVSKEVNALKISGPNDPIKDHDVVTYEIHVHEAYVPDRELKILYSDDQIVVVDKPSGMPTHPTVNYFTKTATELLRPQFGAVVPCYRLDRLTSGVLVLCRSGDIAAQLLQTKRRKTYLARVYRNFDGGSCDAPIVTFNAKRGYPAFLQALKAAKPAVTQFTPVFKDGSHTVVKCDLETGRTHQIRKHLALMGHPIVHDELYSDGLFRELISNPTEASFNEVAAAGEQRRIEKDTGEKCTVCSAPIYRDVDEAIDLHCYEYEINGRIFKSAPDWFPNPIPSSSEQDCNAAG